MTLNEIQAQYGDGVWLLVKGEDHEAQVLFNWEWVNIFQLSYQRGFRGLLRDFTEQLTVLDVEVVESTQPKDYAQVKAEHEAKAECIRLSCPDILAGHSFGCRWYK